MSKYLIAALAGAASVASYAPLEWWWLMPICVAVFFLLLSKLDSIKSGFLIGFSFGLCQFGFGASWVYVSLKTYGNMPAPMAAFGVFLFVASLGLFNGLLASAFLFIRKSRQHIYGDALLFASLWVIAEWLRSIVFTGFPWLDVGYSQTTRWLSGYAALGSVYLVSFMTVACSVLLAELLRETVATKEFKRRSVKLLFPVFMIVIGGFLLQQIHWTQAQAEAKKILLVQGNVPIEQKWLPEFQGQFLTQYYEAINRHEADLVVLPETALPLMLHELAPDFLTNLRGQNKAILTGVVERDLSSGRLYNSAILECGANVSLYRKQHLVPFGEYLPLRFLFDWVLDYLQLPMSDFSAGQSGQNLDCDEMQISLSICYEDAFASEVRQTIKQSAGILVNISEDAWFGDSLAPHQRVQMAQMRALESARPMIRVGNSGPSTVINSQGQILQSTGQFIAQDKLVSVTPRQGKTPFIQFGLWIVWWCMLFVCLKLVVNRLLR